MIILSNNQWYCDENAKAWAARGEDCSAEARIPEIVKAYLTVLPDIICLQESSGKMGNLMMTEIRLQLAEKGLGDVAYAYVSGRDTPIVYRSDLLSLVESGFFLYPQDVPGFEGEFNNSESKSYCWCVFRERATSKYIAALSTHLWWKSDDPQKSYYYPHSGEARAWQLQQSTSRMNEIMRKYNCPVFVMGDFNAIANSKCVQTAYADGWQDVHDVCQGKCDNSWGYHYCSWDNYRKFEWKPFEEAIDHMLFKSPVPLTVKRFARIMPEWFDKLSDHYPLYAEIEF